MSETTEQTVSDAAPEQQSQTPAAEAQGAETTVQTQGGEEQTTEQTPEPKPEPKPKRTDRHIAHLTARAAEEQRLREAAEKRAEAAEALLRAGKTDDAEPPPTPRQPTTDVSREQLREEIRFTDRLNEIDANGKKELGPDAWEQAKATLTGLGAVNNQAFLQALAEAENPHKLFASLADDPDTLMELLKRPPVAMAARIARMDADLSRPAPRPLSAAPTPAPRTTPGGTVKPFDPYNPPPGISMREWNREMDPYLPPSLLGRKKSA